MTIGRSLGKGTFGKVKLATHVLTGEKVTSPNKTLIGSYQNSWERQNKRQERCGEDYKGNKDLEKSEASQCNSVVRSKDVFIKFLDYWNWDWVVLDHGVLHQWGIVWLYSGSLETDWEISLQILLGAYFWYWIYSSKWHLPQGSQAWKSSLRLW